MTIILKMIKLIICVIYAVVVICMISLWKCVWFTPFWLKPASSRRRIGRDSSVGIAIRYGLDGPGIESLWGPGFPHASRQALGPTQPPVQWAPALFPGGGWSVALTTHPHIRRSWRKSRATPVLALWAFVACSKVNFTFFFLSAPFHESI